MADNEKQDFDATLADTNAKLLQELKNCQLELERRDKALQQAQIALEEANQRYTDLYDFSPVAYLILSGHGLIKNINFSGAGLLGLEQQKLLQQPFADFISPTDRERWQLFFAQQIQQKFPQSIQLALKPVDGGVQRYVQLDCLVLRYEGSLILQATLIDITNQKQAETVLYDSEAYKDILATTLDGFLIIDVDGGKLLGVNERYSQLSGYSLQELRNMTLYDLKPPELFATTTSQIQSVTAIGKAQFETVHRRKDGTLWPAEVSVTHRNLDGKRINYVFLRDISPRKQIENELKDSRKLVTSILDSLTSHIAVLDKTGNIIAVNRAWEQFAEQNALPGSDYKMLGCNYLDACVKALHSGEDIEKTAEILRGVTEVLTGIKTSFETEYPCHSADEQRWFYMSVSPLQVDDGGVVHHQNITELKLAEQHLQKSEERLNLCQQYGGIGTWDFDLINNRQVWSRSVYDAVGFPYFSNPSLEDFLFLVHPDDRQLILDAIHAHFYEGQKYELEYRAYLADGQLHWLRAAGQAQFSPDGTPLRFMGYVQDITERKALEQSIIESHNLLRTIIDTVPARIFWKDRHSRYLGCNKAFAQDANMSCPDDLIGTDDFQFVWKKQAETFQAEDLAVMESGVAKLAYDDCSVILDGKVVWSLVSKVPLKNQAGEIIGMVGVYEYITERKRIEQQLQESERKLATIFDILDVGLAVTDEQNNLLDCNQRAAAILGLSKQDVLQRHYTSQEWRIIRPDFTQMPLEEFASVRALATNTTVSHVEMGIVKTDDEIVWLLVSAMPLHLKGYGVVITYIDITEFKRQQQAMNSSENRFRSIIEISPVPMALNDDQHNITFLNPAFIQMFGYDLTDIPTLADWWPKAYPDPDYRHWVKTTWQTLLAEAEAQEQKHFPPVELIIRCKNGTQKTVLASASVLTNTFHAEHLVVLYDISTQKQAETVLIEEREQLENQVINSQEELEKTKIESDKISTALDVVLNLRENDPNSAKNKLSQEMNTVILPLFKKLKRLSDDKHQLGLIDTLENHLQQLGKCYGVDLSPLPNGANQLTPMEMQVALLIKQGLPTKTIASMLAISPDTVCTHRKHIRKKLNLSGTSSNLRSHLMVLLKEDNDQ